MTVRSDKSNAFLIGFVFMVEAIMSAMFLKDGLLVVGWGLLIVDLVFCASWTVSVFRTLSFTEAGITVIFWRWKKEIPWNEVTVRVENYANSFLTGRYDCMESVVFSTKRTHKHSPHVVQHPFSPLFVCVCGCPGICKLCRPNGPPGEQAGILGNAIPVGR